MPSNPRVAMDKQKLWTRFQLLPARCASNSCNTRSRNICQKDCILNNKPTPTKHAPVTTDGNFVYVFEVDRICVWEFNTLSFVWRKVHVKIIENEWPELQEMASGGRIHPVQDETDTLMKPIYREYFIKNYNGAIPVPNSSTFFCFFDIGEQIGFTRLYRTSPNAYTMERINMDYYLETTNNGGQSEAKDENTLYFSQMSTVFNRRANEPTIKVDIWKLTYQKKEKIWTWSWLTQNSNTLELNPMKGILIHEHDYTRIRDEPPDVFANEVLRWQFLTDDALIWFGTSFNGFLSFDLKTLLFTVIEVELSPGLVDLPNPVDYFNRILAGNCLYVYGGLEYQRKKKIPLDTTWKLDLESKKWIPLNGGMSHPVESSSAVSPEVCIYTFGGKNIINNKEKVWQKDAPTNIVQRMWLQPPSLQRIAMDKLAQSCPALIKKFDMHASNTIDFMKNVKKYFDSLMPTVPQARPKMKGMMNKIHKAEEKEVCGIMTRKKAREAVLKSDGKKNTKKESYGIVTRKRAKEALIKADEKKVKRSRKNK